MIICSKLSEIALQLELALGHAESMTESNDPVYGTNFETGKVKVIRIDYYGNPYQFSIDFLLEEKTCRSKRTVSSSNKESSRYLPCLDG
jgi:hypothetical protein